MPKEHELKLKAARNPFCPLALILLLSLDDSPEIRRTAIIHPRFPRSRLVRFKTDEAPEVRDTAIGLMLVEEELDAVLEELAASSGDASVVGVLCEEIRCDPHKARDQNPAFPWWIQEQWDERYAKARKAEKHRRAAEERDRNGIGLIPAL